MLAVKKLERHNMKLTGNFDKNTGLMDAALRVDKSFDLIRRTIKVGSSRGVMYMIDGFVKDEILEKMMEFLMKADAKLVETLDTPKSFADSLLSYIETDITDDMDKLITMTLSGSISFLVEGYEQAFIIDARTYPVRSLDEPGDDKVLRGSHDGFVETMVFNTALIRRRIRDPELVMRLFSVGRVSKTDIVLSYHSGRVNKDHLDKVVAMIDDLNVSSLTMSQESLMEALMKKGWLNPYPKVRYTERPDTASSCIMEGKLVIIVDNSPSVIILPSAIFDFVQESNDFYFPPLVGTYLRFVRMIMSFIALFLTPVWYLLASNPELIPSWLEFIKISEPNTVPLVLQIIMFEFTIDALKLASLNTPNSLSNSFSVVGALILGEFAIQARWFVPEVILYMGIVAIATFTQNSFELGYAFKLSRILIILLTALLGIWGFILGIVIVLLLIALNSTPLGRSYLYPLIPFNGKALLSLLVRRKMSSKNS